MKNQKLGRGLNALIGEIEEVYENELSSKDSLVELDIKDIKPNPYQPRKYFNDESLLELSESIKNDGLIQPIIVTQNMDEYVLIAGERRLRASKLAKLKTIKAVVLNSDEHKMRQYALIENIQRDELNAIELALAYAELIKLHSITQEELAFKIHKSRVHITNTLRLLQLSSATQKALIEKKITPGHAKVLVGLDEKEQQVMVDSIIGQKLSVRDTELSIKNIKNYKPLQDKKRDIVGFDFTSIKDILKDSGFSTKSSQKAITIEFKNQNELDLFLEILQKQ